MRYAAFFKTHQWDDLIAANLALLAAQARHGDLYILFDTTHAAPPTPPPGVSMLTVTQDEIEAAGLHDSGGFWYNGDYAPILTLLRLPQYDHYVFLEYDVANYHSIDDIVATMAREGVDIVGQPIETEYWPHEAACRPYYDSQPIQKALFCVGFYSRTAIAFFYARRLLFNDLRRARGLSGWPIGEALMATEAQMSGLTFRALSDFCADLDHYEWNNGMTASYAAHLRPERTFLHPVGSWRKFVESNFNGRARIDDTLLDKLIFERNAALFSQAYYLAGNTHEDRWKTYAAYCAAFGNQGLPHAGAKILSYGAHARQSSTCIYSHSENESDRVLNLLPRGSYSIHTMGEEDPWWCVDLGTVCDVAHVHIYDRKEFGGARTMNLAVSIGLTEDKPSVIYHKTDAETLLAGQPIPVHAAARFIKIHILGRGMLNLDTVVITGT